MLSSEMAPIAEDNNEYIILIFPKKIKGKIISKLENIFMLKTPKNSTIEITKNKTQEKKSEYLKTDEIFSFNIDIEYDFLKATISLNPIYVWNKENGNKKTFK